MTSEIKNASIQQINIAYNAVEDRLLLKIGFSDDAEIAVWLTRRLVRGLWQLLMDDEITSQDSIAGSSSLPTPVMTKQGKTRDLQKLDFTSEYKQRQTMSQDDILLARDCHIRKSAHQKSALELLCTNGQTIRLVLTQDLAVALTNMLQLVSKETAWGLPVSVHTPIMNSIQTSSALH
jgi:hypothetical protein